MAKRARYVENELTRKIISRYGNVVRFCRHSGLSYSTIKRVLIGQKNFHSFTVMIIADCLGEPFDYVADQVGMDKSKLRREIFKRGYSMEEFAYKTELRTDTLNRICDLCAKPHTKTIWKIAIALEMTFEEVESMCLHD